MHRFNYNPISITAGDSFDAATPRPECLYPCLVLLELEPMLGFKHISLNPVDIYIPIAYIRPGNEKGGRESILRLAHVF
jgi:hypothetical protein